MLLKAIEMLEAAMVEKKQIIDLYVYDGLIYYQYWSD